jgi:hypothetical protein
VRSEVAGIKVVIGSDGLCETAALTKKGFTDAGFVRVIGVATAASDQYANGSAIDQLLDGPHTYVCITGFKMVYGKATRTQPVHKASSWNETQNKQTEEEGAAPFRVVQTQGTSPTEIECETFEDVVLAQNDKTVEVYVRADWVFPAALPIDTAAHANGASTAIKWEEHRRVWAHTYERGLAGVNATLWDLQPQDKYFDQLQKCKAKRAPGA